MKTTSFRARSLACALLATTAYCGLTAQPAAAQSASAPAPAHDNVDANGVDLVTGKFRFAFAEAAIGSGDGALALVRHWGDSTFRDNWSSGLYHVTSGGTTTYYVELGHLSDSFTLSGGSFVSNKANGATLSESGGQFFYQAADGTSVTYRTLSDLGFPIQGYACASVATGSCAIPISITRPNGMTYTLQWDIIDKCSDLDCTAGTGFFRFRGVSNEAGYSFTVNYLTDNPGNFSAPQSNWYKKTGTVFANANAACASTCPSLSYSESGGITTVTDAVGRQWRFDASTTQLTGIRRPGAGSDTMTISYGTGGIVSSVTRDGVTTSYSRSVSGNTATTTITNALSQQTVVVADLGKGRITSVTDPLSRSTSYQYDGNGRLTRVTAPEGNYVEHSYDGRGNVTQTQAVAKSGSGLATITSSASYDASCANPVTCNSPNSVTDARGNTTDYTYDSNHGGVLTATAPAPTSGATRPQARYSYSLANGRYVLTGISACQTSASCTGGSDESKSTLAYDANGNVTGTSSGNGSGTLTATSTMTYTPAGDLVTVDGPLSGSADTVKLRYNAMRELVGTVSADPDGGGSLKHRAVRNTIGSTTGLLTKTERGTVNSQSDSDWAAFSALEAVEIGYDSNSRPTTQKLTSGGTTYALTQTGYDAVGRPECVAQRMNPSAFGSLPSSACSLGTQGSFGPDRIAKTIYDAAGQVTQVKTALGVTGEEANEVTSTYTSNGRVQTVTDAENNKTTYVYDGHDRLSQTQFPSTTKGAGTSNSADYEQPGYDANGNVTSFRNRANETIGFTFDALNRMTAKDLPGSEPDASYTYDLLGRMTGASQTGHSLSFTYDALGRNLTQVGPHGTVTSTWDVAGRRTRITHPDAFYVDQDYLVTGEVEKIRENGATSGVGVLATFAYDDLGRRTTLTRGNGTVTSYSFDAVSRLSQLTQDLAGSANDLTLGFSYNPASQFVQNTRSNDLYSWAQHGSGTTSTTANGLNQIASWNGSLSHDAKGNITAIGSASYGYSSENLLTSAPGYTLSYDPLTRFYELAGQNGRRRVYDGGELLMEYHPSGALARRFVHGPGVDEPLVWYGSGGGTRRFLHADERGSIVSATDVNGSPIVTYRYDEYGGWGSGNSGTFYYTGQTGYDELRLYYYKNRWRHPGLDRFMQTDPIGYGSGMNLYAYVKGDPVNKVDPWGLQDESVITITGKRLKASSVALTGGAALLGSSSGGWGPSTYFGDGGAGGGGGHDYRVPAAPVCDVRRADCARDKVLRKINSPICNVPGQRGTGPIDESRQYRASKDVRSAFGYTLSVGGWVTVDVQGGGTRFINSTTLIHPFQGSVERNYFQARDGSWYVTTLGVGDSPIPFMDAVNQSEGPKLFNQVNAICRAHVESRQ